MKNTKQQSHQIRVARQHLPAIQKRLEKLAYNIINYTKRNRGYDLPKGLQDRLTRLKKEYSYYDRMVPKELKPDFPALDKCNSLTNIIYSREFFSYF